MCSVGWGHVQSGLGLGPCAVRAGAGAMCSEGWGWGHAQ